MTLDKVIDESISSGKRKLLLFITSLGWAYVAAGVMIMPFAQPMVMTEWNLSRNFAASLSSSGFIGMFLGALIAGILSDKFGRKITSILFLTIATLFSFANGFATTPFNFIMFRVISGFGLGGLLPVLNTYLTEFLNVGIRGKYLVLLEASWAFGSIYMAIIHMIFGRYLGWNYDFIFMGIGLLPLILLLFVPESPKYLLIKDKKEEFKKLFKYDLKDISFKKQEKSSLKNILSKKYYKRTILVWLQWFTMSFGYYGIFIWIKGILFNKGIDFVKADWYTFYMYIAQLPGYLLAAYFIEKIGRRKSVLFFMIGTGISSIAFAYSSQNTIVLLMSLIVSIFTLGAWGLTYAYTPELYPTQYRGTANGTSSAVTRFSGFIAPYYTAFFLEKNIIFSGIIGIAILFIITGFLNFIFLPETKNVEVN
jgi:putative MFS transporter